MSEQSASDATAARAAEAGTGAGEDVASAVADAPVDTSSVGVGGEEPSDDPDADAGDVASDDGAHDPDADRGGSVPTGTDADSFEREGDAAVTAGDDDGAHAARRSARRRKRAHDSDSDEEDDDEAARKRRRLRNQFLDVEAEDDDDDDELSGEDEADGEDGFVQDEGGEERGAARVYRQVDRRDEPQFTDADAEQLAERYRERYGRSAAQFGARAQASVPQQLLLPSVEDPPIFGLNCRIGREKDTVRALLRKQTSLEKSGRPLEVFSVFQRDAFPGRIYVEAANEATALKAVAGMPNVFASNKVLKVPIKEYPDMFRVAKKQETELVPGKYVRVRRGRYAGDLAVVVDLSDNGLEARLKLLPRLDYGRTTQVGGAKSRERPPARLFAPQEAQAHDPRGLQQHGASAYTYLGEEYVKGFLHKDFKLAMLEIEGVAPTLAEIARFQDGGDDGALDLASIGDELARAGAQSTKFAAGERVEVTRGEQTGLRGHVATSRAGDGMVTVRGDGEFAGIEISVPAGHLRKHFRVGDHVRVVRGNYKDDTGLVVASAGAQVTLLSDAAQSEITVFARDLRAASDTSVKNALAGFEIQDLVQVNAQTVGCVVDVERETVTVLCQNGQTATLRPESIAMKARAQRTATDARGNEVHIGDTVKEIAGEQRTGVIIHIYHQYVFLHNRERQEHLGVFVNTTAQIETIATKTARDRGLDLTRMNPAAQTAAKPQAKAAHFNTRRIVGQHVAIGPGSGYKGLRGIVRDASETSARVELEARNKTVTVDVQRLLFKAPHSQQLVSLHEFMHPYGRSEGRPEGRPVARAPRTPAWAGARTPAWAAGGKTPAWNGGKTPAAGGRTPAWNGGGRTPAAAGGRTPAWNGGRTPAWNAGNKTPAWNAGNKTPAWNAGGKTPAWNAGGKTPAWSTDAGKTPAWSADSGKTPAWTDSARTPGWSERPAESWSSNQTFFSQQPEDAVVQYDD